MKTEKKSTSNGAPSILGISLDSNLPLGTGARLGDSARRVMALASVCNEYHIVMRTLGTEHQREISLDEKCHIYPTNSRNRISFMRDAVRVGAEVLDANPIDVIYTQDPFSSAVAGYMLKRKFNKPLVISFAGDMIDNPYWIGESPRNMVMNSVGKWLIKKADAFRVCSTYERAKLIDMGVPPERVFVVGWISDFTPFEQADGTQLREQLLADGFDRLLLFVGRLAKQKNIPNLLKSMEIVSKKYSSALLLVIGEGEELAHAKELVRKLGIEKQVVFMGAVDHDKLPVYFSASDVFVLPSYYEGNAIVVMEAAAAKIPSVSAGVSGASDTIVDGLTGYIVENDNPVPLAERIMDILEDPTRAREMGNCAHRYVTAKYKEENIIDAFRNMFTQIRGFNGTNKRNTDSVLLQSAR